MTYSTALDFLRNRFDKFTYELICMKDGYCTGIIFRVGRSKFVAGMEVNEQQLRLFADGIDYSNKKRIEKRAEKNRIAMMRAS